SAPWLLRLSLVAMMLDLRGRGPRAVEASAWMFTRADRPVFKDAASLRLRTADLQTAFRQGTRWPVEDFRLAVRPWGIPLEKVPCPVHIFQGAADTVHTMRMARYLAD